MLLAGAFAVFVGAAAGLDFSVRVGAVVAFAEVVPEWGAPELEVPVVAPAFAAGDGLVLVGAGVGVVARVVGVPAVAVGVVCVAVGVVGVVGVVVGGVGVCEEGVGEGGWLGGAAGSCSGSHD